MFRRFRQLWSIHRRKSGNRRGSSGGNNPAPKSKGKCGRNKSRKSNLTKDGPGPVEVSDNTLCPAVHTQETRNAYGSLLKLPSEPHSAVACESCELPNSFEVWRLKKPGLQVPHRSPSTLTLHLHLPEVTSHEGLLLTEPRSSQEQGRQPGRVGKWQSRDKEGQVGTRESRNK